MRRLTIALLAGTLGVTLAVVPPTLAPDQAAQALCISSISPQCQPGNIPILVQAGVIAAPSTSSAGVGIPAYSTISAGLSQQTSAVAGLTLSGILGTSATAFAALWSLFSGGEAQTDAVLSQDGIKGLKLDTDPAYTSPGGGMPDWATHTNGECFMASTQLSDWRERVLSAVTAHCDPAVPDVVVLEPKAAFNDPAGTMTFDTTSPGTLALIWQRSTAPFSPTSVHAVCSVGGVPTRKPSPTITVNTFDASSTKTATESVCGIDPFYGWLVSGPFGAVGYNGGATLVGPATDLPAGGEPIVEGTLTVSISCKGPGGVYEVEADYAYSVAAGESVLPPDVTCQPGDIAIDAGVTNTSPGQTEPEVLVDREQNGVLPEIEEMPDLYPECFGPDASPCALRLERANAGAWVTCGDGAILCPDWAQLVEPALTDQYRCVYGTNVLDIRYCSSFRAPSIGLLPNTDENGDLIHPNAPIPKLDGFLRLYTPQGDPWLTPELPGAFPDDVVDLARECYPNIDKDGWGVLNPVSWVLQPIQCALRWAFVPRTSVLEERLTTVSQAWETSPPGQIVNSVALIIPETVPQGCEGIPFSLAPFADAGGPALGLPSNTVYIAPACEGDILQPWAVMVNLLLSGTVLILGIRAMIGQVGALVNGGGPAG